jgi:hypothetical protein
MSEDSTIFIAAKPVVPGVGYHLYLVYDADGDPTNTDDETVIRGGPAEEGQSDVLTDPLLRKPAFQEGGWNPWHDKAIPHGQSRRRAHSYGEG